MRAVGRGEIIIDESACTSGAFGHVIAGQFEMDAAQQGPSSFVDVEGLLEFREDVTELSGLDLSPQGGAGLDFNGFGVAVHGITGEEHGPPGRSDHVQHGRETSPDLLGAETVDQGDPSRFIIRIENLQHRAKFHEIGGGPDLHADRISNAAEIFDMSAIGFTGADTDPWHVRPEIPPTAAPGNLPGHRGLVHQQERFMAAEEIDALHLTGLGAGDGFHESE